MNCPLLAAALVWSFVVSLIILLIMDRIPGLKLRISIDAETNGIDHDQFNEFTHDYIEVQRDLYAASARPTNNLVTVTTVDTQNIVTRKNDIKMVKIKPKSTLTNAWVVPEVK